jgi:rubredoxin
VAESYLSLPTKLNCEYKLKAVSWACVQCGHVFKTPAGVPYPKTPPKTKCPWAAETIKAATEAADRLGLLDAAGNLAEEAVHYARSLAQWAWAGFPVRTADETAIRYEICLGCDIFAGGKCTICGCPVKKKRGMLIKNKAGIATETCPYPKGSKWPPDD